MATSAAEALEFLSDAVAVLRTTGDRRRFAVAVMDHGSALRRVNRRQDARKALREGLELALAEGDTALAERARDEVLGSAERLRRDRSHDADALTPAERRIARLAAQGYSNPEIARTLFLTRKTVENQLSRVYRKLGIGARQELQVVLPAA